MKNGASPSAVRGIMNDSNGVIWICTINGLFKVSPLTENFEKITFNNLDQDRSNYIKGILEISNNQYVVATMAGLFSLKNSKITPITDHREGYSGTMYYNPQSKYFYAGRNDKDLACYRLNGDQFTKAFEFLAGYSILCVLPDPNDHFKLWIGTDNGLIEFDQHTQKIIRKYSIKDGLPNQVIYSLLLDNNNDIWISTNKGLVCRSRNGDFQKIRQSEEIEFNSFAAHKARTGIMYFGSTQGLYYFNPEVFKKSSSRGLKISSVVINDSIYYSLSEQQPRQPISLKYTENNLTVSLSALDYLSKIPPIFEYRRITDNDSTPWIKTESSIVHFQNLPSDHYHFEFRVLDSNGFYTKPEKLEFNINLPLWKKWWFLLLLLIFIAGVIYRFTKMYIYRQQLRQQKITKRIISAQESERLRIAMDIHDDVNNTLAAAKGYLQQTGAAVTAEYTERSKALIQKATEDLRNITHELMPIDFDRYNLRDVIEHKTDEWNQAHEAITFVYIQAGDPVKLSSEAELIAYRIIMEIIQNIIKHSGALQAVIQLVYTDDSLVISIEDNGAGFSQKPAEKNGGIGLKNVYLRAEYLHANLEISSDKKGVLAQLMIPYDHNRNDSGNPG
jgi:signal transduction histidine kinase